LWISTLSLLEDGCFESLNLESTWPHWLSRNDLRVQVVQCLSSKCETLSSNPSTAKKKKEKKKNDLRVRYQLLTSVILAIWKAEIGKTEVPGQPGA
jgi:hypothetical protein